MTIHLRSNDFEYQALIPDMFSCEGTNVSPHLEWSDLPSDARSLVIILDDPDSSSGIWTHWIVHNIPSEQSCLPQNVSADELRLWGAAQGQNDFGNAYYQGPCPRRGTTHRYFFRLYALDSILDIAPGSVRQEVLTRIRDHVLEHTELIGLFTRR